MLKLVKKCAVCIGYIGFAEGNFFSKKTTGNFFTISLELKVCALIWSLIENQGL